MPVPEGIISTSEVWTQPVEEVVPDPVPEEGEEDEDGQVEK